MEYVEIRQPEEEREPISAGHYVWLSEEEMVALAQQGDGIATEELLQRYRKFVLGKARTYFVFGSDRDDVAQEGMIGLFKAIRDYQPSRSTAFRPFAELCITRHIYSAFASAARRKHSPLNQSSELMPETQPGGSETDEDHRLLMLTLISAVESLSEFERYVLESYFEGKTYNEMSAAHGCTRKSIDNALQRVKRKVGAATQS